MLWEAAPRSRERKCRRNVCRDWTTHLWLAFAWRHLTKMASKKLGKRFAPLSQHLDIANKISHQHASTFLGDWLPLQEISTCNPYPSNWGEGWTRCSWSFQTVSQDPGRAARGPGWRALPMWWGWQGLQWENPLQTRMDLEWFGDVWCTSEALRQFWTHGSMFLLCVAVSGICGHFESMPWQSNVTGWNC